MKSSGKKITGNNITGKKITEKEIKNLILCAICDATNTPYVPVGVSNRHLHLSKKDLELLFGSGYKLTPIKELLPGQYASDETATIKGPKGSIPKVRALGPTRGETQIEISLTDCFKLGINPPAAQSGDLSRAALITIENPINGESIERRCAIVAARHIHVSPEYARRFDLKDKQIVDVEFDSDRPVVFKKVMLRVRDDFVPEMHIDTDEANAGGIKNGDLAKIIIC
jgi:putative phosphotransacetylase